MVIESIMYLVLGLLISGLLALAIIPAVWNRAVRLTKKRIEAATPMTMAEFRADKDQLRAEFALSTRRLEMNVEALRKRLSEQLREINRKKTDLSAIKNDRDNHLTIIRELEEREAELRRRVVELEKESADLGQQVRLRDRELADQAARLTQAQSVPDAAPVPAVTFDGRRLSGDYARDVEDLISIVTAERKRLAFLESQNAGLISELAEAGRRSAEANASASAMRVSLAESDDRASEKTGQLVEAEANIADAEHRLNSLLAETAQIVETSATRTGELLAEKRSLESELEALRSKVATVESTVMADWDTDRIEQSHLRERLNDIAADVSRLVYAVEGRDPVESDGSVFDRVQRFSEDGTGAGAIPARGAAASRESPERPPGTVSERLAALRDIQSRG